MREQLPPMDEATLNALVDGRLDDDARARAEAQLRADPQLGSTAAAWTLQRQALQALQRETLEEAVPASLLLAARGADARGRALDRWARWGGMAASVVVAFGAGWLGHGQWQWLAGGAGGAQATRPADFGRAALVAHAVYSPEVRHPVEVPAAQQEHLVQWLSKRLGRPLKVPDLAAQGFELVGGRLLPGEQGARAQFMYQNSGGERVTLYVGAVTASRPGAAETAFRFASEAGVSTFYWVDQGFGYALSGKLGRQGLLALSESVYRQL